MPVNRDVPQSSQSRMGQCGLVTEKQIMRQIYHWAALQELGYLEHTVSERVNPFSVKISNGND